MESPDRIEHDDVADRIANGLDLIRRGCAVFHGLGYGKPLDNNFLHELIVCRHLELTWHPGRGDADATDESGHEYELKATEIATDLAPPHANPTTWKRRATSWATSRDASPEVIRRYREMAGFYFAVFDGLDLVALYFAGAVQMAPVIADLERRTLAAYALKRKYLNNPKFKFPSVIAAAHQMLLLQRYEERSRPYPGVYRKPV